MREAADGGTAARTSGSAPLGGARPETDSPDPGSPFAPRAMVGQLPELARLVADLLRDPRVPRKAKLAAAAATGYLVVPRSRRLSAGHVGDLAVLLAAVRYLIATAGYDVVHELWRGDDAGFALLLLTAGVQR
jgi:uncharacterized membrane protein YkvA (DUF1232 family)